MDWTPFTDLSVGTQAFIRSAYGLLLLLHLLQTLPVSRTFFSTASYGGYLDPGPIRDRILRPPVVLALMALWIVAALGLLFGLATPLAALVNASLGYYFYIRTRWTGIHRGCGAPGFINAWLGIWLFLLEFGLHCDPSGAVRGAAVFAARLDFALIMFCAGLYKLNAGWAGEAGIELGTVNPWWGYFPELFRRLSPRNPLFRLANHSAYVVQMGAGLMMLLPPTREFGAMLIAIGFVGIATQIRLGWLCEMVILCCLLQLRAGSFLDGLVSGILPASEPVVAAAILPEVFQQVLAGAILVYALLLPFAKAGQYANFYFHKRLPGVLQTALERYTNFFGIIIWRVFTVDVVGFWTEIAFVDPASGERRVHARPRIPDPRLGFRYWHVCEFVCLASLFTTLRYHPSNPELFRRKLVRYARSLPCPDGWIVRFEYIQIRESGDRFAFPCVAEFDVDPQTEALEERVLDPSVDLRRAAPSSPVHEGQRPGTYAPAESRTG